MDVIRRAEIKELAEPRKGPCLSVFVGTHVTAAGSLLERLNDLVSGAQSSLEQQGWTAAAVQNVLVPAHHALGRRPPGPLNKEGLALFSAPGFLRIYSVPFELSDLAVAAHHFHLKPLLPLLEADGPHYVLALGQTRARLYRDNGDAIEPANDIPLPNSPLATFDDGRADANAVAVQCRDIAGPGRRLFLRSRNKQHEHRKQVIAGYFRSIDDVLRKHLEDETPVVLAGVAYLCAMYRHGSRIPGLAAEELHDTADHFSGGELHRRSFEAASAFRRSLRQKTADEYHRLWHTVRASNDVKDIAEAARGGRVKTLFVGACVRNSSAFPQIQSGARPSRDDDLLGDAALDTFLRGGTVFAVPSDMVPGHGPAAAVFRY